MNMCDDDDDIMEFLIHDEDDDFTDALVLIADDLTEEDAADDGDDTVLVPPFVWGSGSRVFYSHLLFHDFWGPSPIYNATYFKKFFKIPLDCSIIL
jgi:hypothetical protein